MADRMQPTPRGYISGLFSDAVNLPLQYMSSPERTQQMQGMAQLLYGTGIPKTLERASYGESLFSGAGGLGGTTRMLPETADALMNVMPFAPKGLKSVTQGTRPIASAAQDAAPLIGYHRTTTPFEGEFQNLKNQFGVSFAGDRGFYFSPEINDETAKIFGNYIISAKVKVKNPAPIYQVSFGLDNYKTPRSIVQVDKEWLKENPEALREGGLTMANSIEDVIAGKTFQRQGSFKEYEQQVSNAAKNKKLFALIDPEKLYDKQVSLLENKGYDGFNYVRPESATSSMPSQIVAFRPEQINRMASGREEDLIKKTESPIYADPFRNTIGSSIR
jgi:hypothetical protein